MQCLSMLGESPGFQEWFPCVQFLQMHPYNFHSMQAQGKCRVRVFFFMSSFANTTFAGTPPAMFEGRAGAEVAWQSEFG
jgi:hypothetical protein